MKTGHQTADPAGVLNRHTFSRRRPCLLRRRARRRCRFAAGYPITPSTEVVERFASRVPTVGGTFIQMEDELAASITCRARCGAGAKAFTVTSGPGFSLMMEHIGYAAMTETPCVFVDVQRGGPSTGLPTLPAQADMMQARWGSHGDYEIIALCPNSPQECFDLTIKAFNLSEEYRVPVMFMMDEVRRPHDRKGSDSASRRDRNLPAAPHAQVSRKSICPMAPTATRCRKWRMPAKDTTSTYRLDARRTWLSEHDTASAGQAGPAPAIARFETPPIA